MEKIIQKNWTSKRFNVNWAGRCFRFWTISIFLVLHSSNFNSWIIWGNSLSHKYCRNCTIIFINRKFISIDSLFSKKGEYPVYVIHFINNSNSHFFYCHLYSSCMDSVYDVRACDNQHALPLGLWQLLLTPLAKSKQQWQWTNNGCLLKKKTDK